MKQSTPLTLNQNDIYTLREFKLAYRVRNNESVIGERLTFKLNNGGAWVMLANGQVRRYWYWEVTLGVNKLTYSTFDHYTHRVCRRNPTYQVERSI